MRKTVALPFAALALASVIAAGCSGNGYNAAAPTATATPLPTPSTPCVFPAGESVQEVFPQNGSLSAPNLEGVVIAVAPNPLPTNWFFYAAFQPATTQTPIPSYPTNIGFFATPVPAATATAGATATPLPLPSDTPLFANPIFESATIGHFANNSRFTIYAANTTCFPGIAMSTFTTSLTDSPTPTPSPVPT